MRQFQAFQHVCTSSGKEVTLAGWEPGKPTIKTGPT
jgi:peroxiredoxin (alkyl hydroperoxide reductase subunit C)